MVAECPHDARGDDLSLSLRLYLDVPFAAAAVGYAVRDAETARIAVENVVPSVSLWTRRLAERAELPLEQVARGGAAIDPKLGHLRWRRRTACALDRWYTGRCGQYACNRNSDHIDAFSKVTADSSSAATPLATRLQHVDVVAAARIPLSTYRLQFNSRFTFAKARAIVDYLKALGIGDCYASSYLAAVPGSPHGYDVADPTHLNPDIGTDEEYWAWVEEMRARGMGHVLDVVPNHMGIAKSANLWWQDVLENGACSRYARFFDIEWHPVKDELADKLLIPILGDQYGAALERQELQLSSADGTFTVRYSDVVLPIAPDTYAAILTVGLE